MKITICSNGVFYRPTRTKVGESGYVAEITFIARGRGRIKPGAYTISKVYVTDESAWHFHDEQMERLRALDEYLWFIKELPNTKLNPRPHSPL